MRKRGFTLMEILIYSVLSLVALGVIYALFILARRTAASSFSSYMVGGHTELAISALRRDLSQTALGSITQGKTSPGVSMVSALTDTMQVNPYGAPRWDRHVYYALIGNAGDQTGTLFRYEDPLPSPNLLPLVSTKDPSSKPGEERAALHNVLMPNTKVDNLQDAAGYTSDKFGGFRVQFVRREGGPSGKETLVDDNPAVAGNPEDHTRLVEVELKILQKSGFGKPDFYCIKFRVMPQF